MILVICDKVGERLAFHRYLRRNRVLSWAPSPIDFQSAILARDYSVVVLFYPFHPMFSALDTGDAPRIAVGENAEAMSRYMHFCADPYSGRLLDFLRDIENYKKRVRVGELICRGDSIYNAGYRLSLTPAEHLALTYLMNFGSATSERLFDVCLGGIRADSGKSRARDIAPMICRINSKAEETGGRRIICCKKGRYELCDIQ